jgi:hypothetical protein
MEELLCNLRSQFWKPTNHILMVRDTLVAEEIDADIFRKAPAVWVGAIWERLRTVREEDVGHSNEQFVWVMQHILGKLHPRFNTQKIEDDFRSQWCHDPASVPGRVGNIIAMNIQQIEMSGASGDLSRNLLSVIQEDGQQGRTRTRTLLVLQHRFVWRLCLHGVLQVLRIVL